METKNGPQNKNSLPELEAEFYKLLILKGKSDNTVKNYKTDLTCFNNFLQEDQGNLNIEKLDTPHMEHYNFYLQNRYNSNNSRRRRVQTLRMFFDFLMEKGIFPNNPVRQFPVSPKFLDIPRPTPFIDIKTLWEYLLSEEKNRNPLTKLIAKRNQLLLLLIYGGGLKVSEIKDLNSSSIVVGNGKDVLSRVTVHRKKQDPYTIPLPNIFTKVFNTYIKDLELRKSQDKISFDQLLFNANPYKILSGGLSSRGQEIIFEELRKRLLLKVTPRSLRQSCIFKWLQTGVKDGIIKEWLGVAPSYTLKPFKICADQHIYNEEFLEELYKHHHNIT